MAEKQNTSIIFKFTPVTEKITKRQIGVHKNKASKNVVIKTTKSYNHKMLKTPSSPDKNTLLIFHKTSMNQTKLKKLTKKIIVLQACQPNRRHTSQNKTVCSFTRKDFVVCKENIVLNYYMTPMPFHGVSIIQS